MGKKSTTTTMTTTVVAAAAITTSYWAQKTRSNHYTLFCTFAFAICVSVHGFTHHLFFKDWSLVYPRPLFYQSSISIRVFFLLFLTLNILRVIFPYALCVNRFWLLILLPSLVFPCFWWFYIATVVILFECVCVCVWIRDNSIGLSLIHTK